MAKEKLQKELELEDKNKQKAQDTNASEENGVDNAEGDSDGLNDIEKKLKDLQDRLLKTEEDRKKESELRKLADERSERLERESREHEDKAKRAENKAAITQKEAINQSVASSQAAIEAAEVELENALAETDAKKVVSAQKKLSQATYVHEKVKDQQAAYSVWEKQQEEAAKQPKVQQLPQSVQNWIDRNPKYKTDPDFKAEADGAHDVALKRGYAFGSSAYLNFIDSRVKQIFDTKNDEDAEEEVQTRRPSAPPNRGGSNSSDDDNDGDDIDTRVKKVKLTAAQREAAKFSGMSEVEYAKYMLLEKQRGRQ